MREVEENVRKLLFVLTRDETVQNKEILDIENTPKRVAKMLVGELLAYPNIREEDFVKYDVSDLSYNGIIVEGPIRFTSMCSHHLLPFYGEAFVGLLPNNHVLGLSKYARIVELFSKRLQLQEKLGSEILSFIEELIKPACVVVILRVKHMCVCSRGVKQDALTVTSHVYPVGDETNRAVIEEIQHCIRMTQMR